MMLSDYSGWPDTRIMERHHRPVRRCQHLPDMGLRRSSLGSTQPKSYRHAQRRSVEGRSSTPYCTAAVTARGYCLSPLGATLSPKRTGPGPIHGSGICGASAEEYCIRRGLTLKVIPNAYSDDPRAVAYEEAFLRSGLQPDPNGSPISNAYSRPAAFSRSPAKTVLIKNGRNQLNRAEKNPLLLEVSDVPKPTASL